MRQSDIARSSILENAYSELMHVAERSDFIKVETPESVDIPGWPRVERLAGWAPELYLITYTCGGLAGITETREPVRSEFHQFAMYLTRNFPAAQPKMAWITPIWHPNIDHAGNRHICTNAAEFHFALRPLSDLVLYIGEMVQYKRYFAKHEPPWPLDAEVARWVCDVAEPHGWISPDKPVDARPLVRADRIRAHKPSTIRFTRKPTIRFATDSGASHND